MMSQTRWPRSESEVAVEADFFASLNEEVRMVRELRDTRIRKLVAAGWTYVQVAQVADLTDRRIAQIIKQDQS